MRRITPRPTLGTFAAHVPLRGDAADLVGWLATVARASLLENPTLPRRAAMTALERAIDDRDGAALSAGVTHHRLTRRLLDRLWDEANDEVLYLAVRCGRLAGYGDVARVIAREHPTTLYDVLWGTDVAHWSSHPRGEEILARASVATRAAWFAATAATADLAELAEYPEWLGGVDPGVRNAGVDEALRCALEWHPERFGEFVRSGVTPLEARCAGSRLLTDEADQWHLAGLDPSGEPTEAGWPGPRTRTLVSLINNPRTLGPVLDGLARALGPADPSSPRSLAMTLRRRLTNHGRPVTGDLAAVRDPDSLEWLLTRCGIRPRGSTSRRAPDPRPYDARALLDNPWIQGEERRELSRIARGAEERPADAVAAFHVALSGQPTGPSSLSRTRDANPGPRQAASELVRVLGADPAALTRYFALAPTWAGDEASLRETVRSLSGTPTGARA